jgi:hypothetical protein
VYAAQAHRSILRQRTAPYLGVVCLALLAFASGNVLPAELAQLAEGQSFYLLPTGWSAGASASHALLGTATTLAAHVSALAHAASGHAYAFAASWRAMLRAAPRARPIAPLARDALAVPALLVAIALALCR